HGPPQVLASFPTRRSSDLRFSISNTLFGNFIHFSEHLIDFGFTEGGRVIFSEEVDYTGYVFNNLNHFISKFTIECFQHKISWEEDFFTENLFTRLDFKNFFDGAKYLYDCILPAADFNFLIQVFLYFFLFSADYP